MIGDAAYYKDPITAHGITDALRDAELLARAVLVAPHGGQAQLDALRDYQHTRDRLSDPLFDLRSASLATSGTLGSCVDIFER